jgi:uncharacterized tellurite resistance protein B-like protein
MHILLALVAIIGVIGVWYWRFKMAKQAADEITDAAGTVWGKWKRYKFRKKAESAPVEAVDDPAAAAVVMMIAVASAEHPLSQEAEAVIRDEITTTMGIADPTELFVFGKWVASHVEDANNVSLRYAKLWHRDLDRDQRLDLVRMVERAVASDGRASGRQIQQIAKLHERLGLKP